MILPNYRAAFTAARARHSIIAAAVALIAVSAMYACTESPATPLSPDGAGGTVSLALIPQYHLLAAASDLPINGARLTVLDAGTRVVIAGPFTVSVDPNSAEFTLPVS